MNRTARELAIEVYNQVDGADHKAHKNEMVQEIYDWLVAGLPDVEIQEYTVDELVVLWKKDS